ncbi:unnamed protein product [Prorocentrum cordatum]|uniref:Uncharacterized protein n=1 Tax=Prorocentrum cordatum TaxID=2364126 RepID=A0ABN9RK86_9DINO|nr:unnamed protein product [Polarella glacialis]
MPVRLSASTPPVKVALLGAALLALRPRSGAGPSRAEPLARCRPRPAAASFVASHRGRPGPAASSLRGARGLPEGVSARAAEGGGLKLVVCSGSSCEGRCRGAFDALRSFKALASEAGPSGIEVEEVFCMNMCKKGPNVRLLLGGQMVTIDDVMNEREQKRGAFQGVLGDPKVAAIWGLARDVAAGRRNGTLRGPPPAVR